MLLSELLSRSGCSVLSRGGDTDPDITDIVYDSRKVTPGVLYIAVPGTKVHGDSFIARAVGAGASAVMSENPQSTCSVPWVQSDGVRGWIGRLGRVLFSVDIDEMVTVGITGTNGKTTVAHLYEALYSMRNAAERVWMFGTIDFHIDGKKINATHTTPESLEIFRAVGAAQKKPSAVVMEVSSHALALDRVGAMKYDVAVFTNLTQDHLDFHKTMESYFGAKSRLFNDYLKMNGRAVINCDDEYGRRLAAAVSPKRCVTFGRAADADCRIALWECTWEGCSVDVVYDSSIYTFTSSLRGFFNVYNMTTMIAGAFAAGFSADEIQQAFNRVAVVDGRMQRIIPEAPFAVVVDYAHTPDALANVLRTAKELTRGRLFCVFGCGGDRDRTKRPLMGAAVAALCDEAWVTSDNPRSEDPQRIISEIVEGIPLDFPHQVVVDRKEAVSRAMAVVQPGDCLVIAGKGHETYQEIKGVRHHFDDKEIAVEAYAALMGSSK